MPAALPLQAFIAQASQNTTQYKVLEVKYGNGYSQRAGDGFNNNQASWSIDYGTISLADLTTILTAFDAAKGVDYFTWTAPGDSASKKWVVKQHTRKSVSGLFYTLQATLEQCFDL